MALSLAMSGLYCSGKVKTDGPKPVDDPGAQFSQRAPLGFVLEDDLDATNKERVIWRYFDSDKDGKVTLVLKLTNSNVNGRFSVLNSRQQTLETVPMRIGTAVYTLVVNLRSGEKYYLKMHAKSGKTRFFIKPEFKEKVIAKPKGPCGGRCSSTQACISGVCKRPTKAMVTADCPNGCVKGSFCVAGKCWRECFGDCGSGSWCNPQTNSCDEDPCKGKHCPKGQRCNRLRGGICVKRGKVRDDGPKVCEPPCGPGRSCFMGKCYTPPEILRIKAKLAEKKCKKKCRKGFVCHAGKCVKKGNVPVTLTGSRVSSKVVSTVPLGSGTIMVLSRGSEHGVKVGARCVIKGVKASCKVIEVFPFRCKAKTSASSSDVNPGDRVTIAK
ncbi:MAG: hypothetical protein KC609_16750 [Myxococcales bacterium]|nr:hypothetical protein [Myxococcales bacterium]